jgi:hypothetical protein
MWGSRAPDAIAPSPGGLGAANAPIAYELFQGLIERTCQTPVVCLQASPCSQDWSLPLT